MGVATGCGCKEVYLYIGIDFLILLIPTPLVSVLYVNCGIIAMLYAVSIGNQP